MERIAVMPGSFDPVTLGHIDIIERALPLFDKLIIAIGKNAQKQSFFTLEQRINWLQEIYLHEKKVEIHMYDGLTVDFCKSVGAQYIVRGMRNVSDYAYENLVAQNNRTLVPEIESVFLMCSPEYTHISSSVVREILRYKGDVSKLVPAVVSRDA